MTTIDHSGPRHLAPRSTVRRGILSTAGLFAAAIVIAIAASGSTYALWNDTEAASAASISSGSTGLTINGVTDYTVGGLTATTLLPGRSVVSPVPLLIENTGTTPLLMSVTGISYPNTASTALGQHLTIVLRQGTTCNTSPDGSAAAVMTGPVNFAVGQTISFCMEVWLKPTAPASVQGATADFVVNLNAAQVRP